MKNKLFFLGKIAVITGLIFSFSGCSSIPQQQNTAAVSYQNWGAFGEAVLIPVKDFESRGLVFTEVTFTINDKGQIQGETFTYQALLKKAQEAGGEAIINVTIDKAVSNVSEGLRTSKQETWYGSALAIKYTDAILQENQVFNSPRTFQTSGSTFSSALVPVQN
ncbi:MAG: hypothetical protein LBS37_10425 [Treponema sp.]|jgi:hypothetical protein|nr:hypothetical protein [Treponema sp.]